ncbi:Beta-lactamase [Caulifigura coniformis]|uniref:Beta-lactamase n=1 Tax=Caulifigura coniformis TaxID=2527983 RepID=A0A517SMY5_9PLAN|nr:DUF5060 domain-containing protein [Caulifigura coniformis]QDT57481.1 Beta-lactamase [Caulifigura coniformis]
MDRLIALMMVLVAMQGAQLVAGETHYPGAHWTPTSAAEVGLSEERLEAVAQSLGGRGCILKDGRLVHSWGDQAEKSDWYSSAKPVLSTLLMFAMKEGKVASPDAKIADFGWELSPKDQSMTFRHLASMTSGYARPEAPGAAWAYNDFAIQLYQKTLFDKVFQEDPDACANSSERFGALQLEDGLTFRKTNRRLSASVRDFSRIVLLWMNHGKWNGKEILPAQYFVDNMKPQVPNSLPNTVPAETDDYLKIASYGGGSDHFSTAGPGVYGFNWWFNATGPQHPDQRFWPDAPADTVMSLGHAGNNSVMMPGLGLAVICAQGDWGKSEAGKRDSVINQRLRLIAWAGQLVKQETAKTPAKRHVEESLEQKGVVISGERKQWHRVTLTFRGPDTSEAATPNPFFDYRLNVTFSNGDKSLVVPGYFAADGDAANSGAESGNCWRVHFRPVSTGTWTYKASFRSGPEVAVSDDAAAGIATAFDGASGSFECGPSDKQAPDFRGRGTLDYVGQRYLKFAGDGTWFLKGGVDSPENFLAYYEFDQTKPTHRYLPHALDARASDPTWRDGRGGNLTGALNYLASVGQNSVYMLTMNVKGDGKDVWPWTSMDERVRYDCSKLDQWEVIFDYMDQLGMMQHFVLQEQENDQLLDGGDLGPTRRLYFRELIARFGHHPAITWNLGEENTNTTEQQKAFCRYFHQHDPYRHMVVVHTFPRDIERVYSALVGDPDVDGASLQTNKTRHWTKEWIRRSAEAGRPWVVCLDEIGPANTGVKPDKDDFNHDDVRKDHLWGHLLSGGAGVEWLFGYNFAHNDINLEDFRSRDNMWRQTTTAIEFFQKHLPFTEMASADQYVGSPETSCFAKPGHLYALQWRGGEKEFRLWLPEARYRVEWFNPRRGGKLRAGTIPGIEGKGAFSDLGTPPSDVEKDWIAVVTLEGSAPKNVSPPPAAAVTKVP